MNSNSTATIRTYGSVRSAAVAIIVLICGVGLSAPATAEQPAEEHRETESFRVDAIVVEGLLRTHRDVVERELLFEEGETASVDEVEESVQRLRNTGIFRTVDYEFVDRRIDAADIDADDYEDDGRLLWLTVDERFTISPSFRFGRGGDTLHLLLGVQDVNIGGTFLQGGVTYSRLGDANSFSVWLREPRFLDGRQALTGRAALNNRIYTLYDGDGEIEGGFLRVRRAVALSLNREWSRWFRTGVSSSFSADTFSYSMIGDERRAAQNQRGGLYEPMQTVRVGMDATFGQIDSFEYRREGTDLQTLADQYFHFGDVHPRSNRFRLRLRHFLLLPLESTLALRGELGFRTTEPAHMQFFAGGLDTVRGTYDNRFRGPHHWLANAEYRITTFKNDWLILQNVAFVDGVAVENQPADLLGLTAVTTGLGVRLISRDFHGMVIRLDYAPPILGADGPGISFGAGQFF